LLGRTHGLQGGPALRDPESGRDISGACQFSGALILGEHQLGVRPIVEPFLTSVFRAAVSFTIADEGN
jgi:hypothetical protein